ncbi:MAG TPA: gephyrin-like molybdotransferase Glp [Actinomycetota bacterium]|nr:gephyrin-like molybdotransferase Glp [Actinomycetota bacterium]
MLTVADARTRILDQTSPLDPLELSVTEAHGCVLAEHVTSPEALPPFPSASSDGFALRAGDTSGAASTPVGLTIIGEAAAGRPFAGRVASGEAVRIKAGTALPEGADAVVRQDLVAVVGSSLAIGTPVIVGANLRPAGGDVAKGERIMETGQRIRGMDVGVMASLGRTNVLVRPRPRAVVIVAGDELREPGQELSPGSVRDSNSFALSGMAREAGTAPLRAGIMRDDETQMRDAITTYLPQADVFITAGGEDARSAVDGLGKVESWDLAADPVGSLTFGLVEDRPFFGLPGNPVAAAVAFELFVRPSLLKMAGRRTLLRPEVQGSLTEDCPHPSGFESYLRVRAWREGPGWRARVSARQGTNVVSSLARANALAVAPSGAGVTKAGQPIRMMLLEPLEGW